MRDMQASAWRKLDARTNGDTFNGKLFKAACADASSLLLSSDEIDSLITTAVRAKWREVEPAIFGTLQEGAGPNQAPRLGVPKACHASVSNAWCSPRFIELLRAATADVQVVARTLADRAAQLDADSSTLMAAAAGSLGSAKRRRWQ